MAVANGQYRLSYYKVRAAPLAIDDWTLVLAMGCLLEGLGAAIGYWPSAMAGDWPLAVGFFFMQPIGFRVRLIRQPTLMTTWGSG